MEAHIILVKHPIMFVCIFGKLSLVPKLGIELSQFKSSYLFLKWQAWKLRIGDKRQIWNLLNNLEVHLVVAKMATAFGLEVREGWLPWF